MRILLLSIGLHLVVRAEIVEYKMSEEECKEAGFIPESLKCTLCKELKHFNLEMLMSDCLQCCTEDEEDAHPKYPLAIIEVCECNLARFPQAQAFVHQNMAAEWGDKVRVRHVRGVRPQILLKDSSGSTVNTLNIEKWDTNTIKEFLDEWIE
ncbi:15 kDa selenoprotein [Trichostrongylus colubriformis]|uniref:Selenoprotein F n=1 Tax=Trichostrongylus colubriformis TaxID=6319 RepID=A0AAN8FXX1_TRICO